MCHDDPLVSWKKIPLPSEQAKKKYGATYLYTYLYMSMTSLFIDLSFYISIIISSICKVSAEALLDKK